MNEELLYQINWQIKNDLGTNFYVDKVEKTKKEYEFSLNLSSPVFHIDSSTKEKMINYLILRDIAKGSAKKNKDFKIELPSFKKVNKKVNSRLDILNRESERIVLIASSDNIARLSEVDHFLKPISYVVSRIYHENFFSIRDKLDPKMNKYLNLLEDLKLIKKVEEGYTNSKKLIGVKSKCEDFEDFKISVYSHVLHNAYETLRNFFNFTFIDPYLKIENSYYADSVESNKLLKKEKRDLLHSYLKRYKYIPKYKFYPYLFDLVNSECLQQENNMIYGMEKIYKEVYEMREKRIDFATLTY